MLSSEKGIKNGDLVIDIPDQYIENGKTLLIERYFELFVDNYHLSKPAHYIKRVHQLCLVDTEVDDQRSVTLDHQLQSIVEQNQFVQLIIEIPCQYLKNGNLIKIEKTNANEKECVQQNFEHIYNQSTDIKQIYIKIDEQHLQKGKTIIMQKENLSIFDTEIYQKEQSHCLNNNRFAKHDHLLSKNLMEITIELPPEFLNDGQTITIIKEDSQSIENNFPYHRPSKVDIDNNNTNNH